jgi:hypothetical protein
MVSLTLIRLTDDPGRRVADAQVQHLTGIDYAVEGLHKLRNARREVPPMNIEDIYVIGLELLERRFERNTERLSAVTTMVDLLTWGVVRVREACGELGGQDNLVAYATLLHPLADPGLRLLVLVVVGAVLLSVSFFIQTVPAPSKSGKVLE